MANTVDDLFNEGIAKQRKKLGYSQAQVTEYMKKKGFDWSSITLSKIERGQRKVTAGEAIILAQYFSMDVREVAGLKELEWDALDSALEKYYAVLQSMNAVCAEMNRYKQNMDSIKELTYVYDQNNDNPAKLMRFGNYPTSEALIVDKLQPVTTHIEQSYRELDLLVNDFYHSKEFIDYLNETEDALGLVSAEVLGSYSVDENNKWYIPDDASKDVA